MEKDFSIEQIINSIRQVIINKKYDDSDSEVLELLDIVDDVNHKENINKKIQYLSNIKSQFKNVSSSQQNMHNKTIEDLKSEIIRPYLKQWLDENLAQLVQDIVEKEIKKLILNLNENNTNHSR